ncbi:MAG: response regulator transcription factor [Desulfobacteraceae bacterium]|nr:response regulator transcription factor [Desulfobacteraceae bacterium]
MKIQIILVDNQVVVRQGIRALLDREPDMEVALESADSSEALEKIKKKKPDIVVIEPTIPGFNGPDGVRRFKAASPASELLILTTEKNKKQVRESLQAGAKGYVLKTAPFSEILTAIRTVHGKEYYLSPEISAEIIDTFVKKDEVEAEANLYARLSRREQQVFRLIAEGATTAEVAGNLGISPKTVAKHRMSIMEKLMLKNTATLVHYAARIGIIDSGT